MKLIPIVMLTISLAVNNKAQEHFTFPPQFQTPHSGMFTSQKNPYLPPETHTPLPYFQIHNNNKLPFPYLPPTATKTPLGYPSPFPMIYSSSLRPLKKENDNDDEDEKATTPLPSHLQNRLNRTERMLTHNQKAERREMRTIPMSFQHPIDRIDTKMPYQFNTSPEHSTPSSMIQKMSPRSIIVSDFQRDHSIDQMKAANYPGAQYVPQPSIFISSTTETAIPILRLSNEMDLDGSFSYEALGADQTHYVQHSRMENAGSGKDEQVVEGSYSYVGDNGKTYTVHYIADGNGFRASGDHLPVAPPIPEIIQRSIQYNLAEESKKPPHLKSWNGEQQENELSESEKRHQFAASPPRVSSLFTGKTPESFSHSFLQGSNTQNHLVAAASSQTPVQTSIDYSDQIQTKQNTGTISPQITFLASQGAHVPSANSPQQTISRIFTTEKATMPQLINYEANIRESDQENNKALWRWQYGINSNQNMEKNSISRSFGADDIVINFNDMTPEQYTNMIKQQVEPAQSNDSNKKQRENNNDYNSNLSNDYHYTNENLRPEHPSFSEDNQYSTERITPVTHSNEWYKSQYDPNKSYLQNTKDDSKQNEGSQTSRPKLITQHQFIPHSQTVTQTYNYDEDNNFESRKTKILNSGSGNANDLDLQVIPLNYEKNLEFHMKSKTNEAKNESKTTITPKPTTTITSVTRSTDFSTSSHNLKFTDFIVPDSDNKNDFKPVFKFAESQPEAASTTTTTEASIEDAIEENIFLKNLFRNHKNNYDASNKIREDEKNKIDIQAKPIDMGTDKHPTLFQYQHKPNNDNQVSKKPMDIAEILNYISKNQFESNKLKLKPKQAPNNFKPMNEMHYYTQEQDSDVKEQDNNRNYRTLQQQEELRGVIKNYKVLHRNNNYANLEQVDVDRLRRNLSPPPLKTVNLPPLGRAGPSMKSYLPPIYV